MHFDEHCFSPPKADTARAFSPEPKGRLLQDPFARDAESEAMEFHPSPVLSRGMRNAD